MGARMRIGSGVTGEGSRAISGSETRLRLRAEDERILGELREDGDGDEEWLPQVCRDVDADAVAATSRQS